MKGFLALLFALSFCMAHEFTLSDFASIEPVSVENPSDNPIVDFLVGFLEGIQEPKKVEDLLKCLEHADQIIEKIMRAIKLIMKMTINDILSGLKILFEALLELEKMLAPCVAEFKQFAKLMEKIKNADIMKIVFKIVMNTSNYIARINKIIMAFQKGDMKKVGHGVGDLLFSLFLEDRIDKAFDIMEFLKGFLQGLNEKGDVKELIKCVKELDHVVAKILAAIKLILTKEYQNIVKGLTLLFEAINEFLNILAPCTKGFEQIKKLLEAFQHLEFMKLIYKILANPQPYIQNCMGFYEAMTTGNWNKAGFHLGAFLYQLFLTKVPTDDDLNYAIEFCTSYFRNGNLSDIERCLNDYRNSQYNKGEKATQ